MSEKFSPERKHSSALPLTENLIWETIIYIRVKNKVLKGSPKI